MMKLKKTLAATLAGCVAFVAVAETGKSTPKGFTDDLDAALKAAEKSGKSVLAVFSGSDWCYWCKKLEKEQLSKPEFTEEAAKTFELVFIDNPRDESVLSEKGRKNNRDLTEKYGVRGFPTVKILNAKGKEICDSQADRSAAPRDYAKAIAREVKTGAITREHLGPFETRLHVIFKAYSTNMRKAGDDEKRTRELTTTLAVDTRAIRKDLAAAKTPDTIAEEKAALLKRIDGVLAQIDKMLKEGADGKGKAKK